MDAQQRERLLEYFDRMSEEADVLRLRWEVCTHH